ncbi:ExbD/TolR family protein [Dinghuibacter silviterrae]|uniref:Outer membrane transport energization protein ExbD n=1 Tax=Dinghuibacter silviterrae TaxID=1539049 RepID=A0A4R8DNA5_9BACT|nr:biopolymer transporter ExbD [Dinghuibacter silviterrae]TDW99278.1 outer membrane transport energization protein ExbD [Dinghuibacter silviterrae]
MPRVKIPRKSTTVDMTAMCDVAFLLLTFFMLATKFKPDDVVKVAPPSSVSSDDVPDKNAFQVMFDKDGKVFFSYNDDENLGPLIDVVSTQQNLGLSPAEKKNLAHILAAGGGLGMPFAELKQVLDLDPDSYKAFKQPGIPAIDSAHNELRTWVTCLLQANGGRTPDNVLIKGDNGAKYPAFKEVIRAFTDNKVFHFKLVTAMADAPPGTALWDERHKK